MSDSSVICRISVGGDADDDSVSLVLSLGTFVGWDGSTGACPVNAVINPKTGVVTVSILDPNNPPQTPGHCTMNVQATDGIGVQTVGEVPIIITIGLFN